MRLSRDDTDNDHDDDDDECLGRSTATAATTTGVNHQGLCRPFALGASWRPRGAIVGPSWGHVGGLFGPSWGSLRGPLGALLGPSPGGPQRSWGGLGAILEAIHQRRGGVLVCLLPSGPSKSPLWALLGRSWSALGRSWGRLEALLGLSWSSLGPFWNHLEAKKANRKRKGEKANTHRTH